MRKAVALLLAASVLFVLASMPSLAGGGQVMGAKGQGQVNQQQVMDPPPFN